MNKFTIATAKTAAAHLVLYSFIWVCTVSLEKETSKTIMV